MLVHVAAHVLPGQTPFAKPEPALQLWGALRRSFPSAIAACLMPDHLHMLIDSGPELVRSLGAVLSGCARALGEPRLWLPISQPQPIRGVPHLKRDVRYLHLNPAREKLVSDPLVWRFSTHRGVIGAEVDPWVTAERLAPILGVTPHPGFAEKFHRYISSDPTVDPRGSRFPRPSAPSAIPSSPLSLIVSAVAAATPWSGPIEQRRILVALCRHQGWRDAGMIARASGLAPSSVRRLLRAARAEGDALLGPALLCLGDERLRTMFGDQVPSDRRTHAALGAWGSK